MKVLREIKLTIRSERGEPLAVLIWSAGQTRALHVKEQIERTVNRWLRYGLDDVVGEGADGTPRSTPSTSPDFLPHLEEYLAGQFSFRLLLERDHVTLPLLRSAGVLPTIHGNVAPFADPFVQRVEGYDFTGQVSATFAMVSTSMSTSVPTANVAAVVQRVEMDPSTFN